MGKYTFYDLIKNKLFVFHIVLEIHFTSLTQKEKMVSN